MLTERAQRVVARAQELAGTSPVSASDILEALFEEDENAPGIKDLVRLGIGVKQLSEYVRARKEIEPVHGFEWTVLQTAAQEALSLGLRYVGTEFILLAMISLGHLTPCLESLGYEPKLVYAQIQAPLLDRPRRGGGRPD